MRVVHFDGVTALVEIQLVPGIISGGAVKFAIDKLKYLLAELSQNENIFLKEVLKDDDYFAVIAIETKNLDRAIEISKYIEGRTKKISFKLSEFVASTISQLA